MKMDMYDYLIDLDSTANNQMGISPLAYVILDCGK
jgi:hypothetical protein